MSTSNLRNVLLQATRTERLAGLGAWWRYNDIMQRVGDVYGFDVKTTSAVFSALSPNNDYLSNVRDTVRVLRATRDGKHFSDFKVSTYGANKRKAWDLAHGAEPLDLLRFPKTRSFYLNIYQPSDPEPVTVDGHIFNVWQGRRINLNSAAQKFTRKMYGEIAEGVREIAREHSLISNQVQSIIWFTWKRIHKIKSPDQIEIWGPDYMIAGLGFEPELT